jgi:hypothetical protein
MDPPVSEIGEATGNHFVHGIVAGVVDALQNHSMTVVEDLYDAQARRLSLLMVEKSVVTKSSSNILKPSVPNEVQAKALDEIEKVIKSLEQDDSELENRDDVLLIETGVKSESVTTLAQLKSESSPSTYSPKAPSLSRPEYPKERALDRRKDW